MVVTTAGVLTGDLVRSDAYPDPLKQIYLEGLAELFSSQEDVMGHQFYRGDSFQLVMATGGQALEMALRIRCWLRAQRHPADGTIPDARVAVGLGRISMSDAGVEWSDGDAFRRSGPVLDQLQDIRLAMTTGIAWLDPSLQMVSLAMDHILRHITPNQAEAFYWALSGLTQSETADRLGVSPAAINQRLHAADWPVFKAFQHHYIPFIEECLQTTTNPTTGSLPHE